MFGQPIDVGDVLGVDGRAEDIGRGVVAFAIDRPMGGRRFNAAHEIAHLLDAPHPAGTGSPPVSLEYPDYLQATCGGATEWFRADFPWIFPNGSDFTSFIGPVENTTTGTPDPLDENWGLSSLLHDGSGDRAEGPIVIDPTRHFAEMGVCNQAADPDHGWLSDVSWHRTLNALAARVGNPTTPLPSTPDAQLRVTGVVDFDADTDFDSKRTLAFYEDAYPLERKQTDTRQLIRAAIEQNLPMMLGLIGLWYNNFFGADTHCVLPYSEALARFPAYLQQLSMESEGKSVDEAGRPISLQTGPVVWGQAGTNGQHAFYQLLHQGTKLVPCDFIGFCTSLDPLGAHHAQLMANFFAQTAALAFGNTEDELAAAGVHPNQISHRRFEGNRPSNTLLIDRLTPESLGKLIGLYEHRTFVLASLWGIDAFDQWGVELGKSLARRFAQDLTSGAAGVSHHDSSTDRLIARFRARQSQS